MTLRYPLESSMISRKQPSKTCLHNYDGTATNRARGEGYHFNRTWVQKYCDAETDWWPSTPSKRHLRGTQGTVSSEPVILRLSAHHVPILQWQASPFGGPVPAAVLAQPIFRTDRPLTPSMAYFAAMRRIEWTTPSVSNNGSWDIIAVGLEFEPLRFLMRAPSFMRAPKATRPLFSF